MGAIETPDDPAGFTIAESGPVFGPTVFAYGGTASGGDGSGAGTVGVDIHDPVVDGRETMDMLAYGDSDLQIAGNAVDEAIVGTSVEVVAWDGVSSADPSVSNARIVNNRLSGGSLGDTVIRVLTYELDPDFDPIAENNEIIRNRIVSFPTEIENEGSDTEQQANVTQP